MPPRIGLSAYSFPWRCGYAGAGTERVCTQPLGADDLVRLASSHGLGSAEIPISMLPDDPARLRALRARAEAAGMQLALDLAVPEVADLERAIPLAASLGARVLRVMISTTLEGARAQIPGGWDAQLALIIERLRQTQPLAAQHDVIVAPENHQDMTLADMLHLCDAVGGDHIGITLDAVNPLAVGEEPLRTARALGHRIANVHLKDYRIFPSSSGYRLVRCAIGDGVLDVPGLFAILAEQAPRATCHIELAAIQARHIRLLEDDWWHGFGPRDAREILPALRLVMLHVRPADEDWRTPWERGANAEALGRYETEQLEQTAAYLRTIGAL